MAVVSDLTDVDKWKSEKRGADETDDKTMPKAEELEQSTSGDEDEERPPEPSVELYKLMSRFQETMSSYRHLVGFGMIMMPTLRSAFIFREMYKNAGKHLEMLDKDQQFETYGVTEDQYPSVQTQIRHLREYNRGTAVLPGAILLSLVATFDSFIADALKIMLRHKPEKVIESSKAISVKDVLNMSSFDDVIGQIIENEVETLMRGSHDEQIGYVENRLDVQIRPHYDEWGDFFEIFERRNLIAHGNDTINRLYIRNCNRHGFQVDEDRDGEKLSLSKRYLRRSSDRLLEFGLSLMFVLWLKHFKDSKENAYESLNGRTYELIKDGQSRVAARLLDLALFKQKPDASDKIRKMMTVNLANAYKKSEDDEKAQEVIESVDWTAATDDFQICVAAIQGNIDRFVELMPRVSQAELIQKSDFREWPVFDWVRQEKRVREKFEEMYGEPIMEPTEQKTGDN